MFLRLEASHSVSILPFVDGSEASFTFLSKWTKCTSGWQNFVLKKEVEDPLKGFLLDGALRLKVHFKVTVFFPLFFEAPIVYQRMNLHTFFIFLFFLKNRFSGVRLRARFQSPLIIRPSLLMIAPPKL